MNKDLYGKNYELPKDILDHLGNHSNNETIGNLLSKGNVSYSLLKKIKHRIENGEKNKLGGDKSASGEKYYEDHEKELEKEFSEIMGNVLVRVNFGGNKEIHYGTKR